MGNPYSKIQISPSASGTALVIFGVRYDDGFIYRSTFPFKTQAALEEDIAQEHKRADEAHQRHLTMGAGA